ncbi:MAG: SH3 domain-containing protein, partial [Myxococcota bacterium]
MRKNTHNEELVSHGALGVCLAVGLLGGCATTQTQLLTDTPQFAGSVTGEDCQRWLIFPGIIPLGERASVSNAVQNANMSPPSTVLSVEHIVHNYLLFGSRCIVATLAASSTPQQSTTTERPRSSVPRVLSTGQYVSRVHLSEGCDTLELEERRPEEPPQTGSGPVRPAIRQFEFVPTTLEEGQLVRVLGEVEGSQRVLTKEGTTGWIDSD